MFSASRSVTRLVTVGDRAFELFPVVATKLWSKLADDVTAFKSLIDFRLQLENCFISELIA